MWRPRAVSSHQKGSDTTRAGMKRAFDESRLRPRSVQFRRRCTRSVGQPHLPRCGRRFAGDSAHSPQFNNHSPWWALSPRRRAISADAQRRPNGAPRLVLIWTCFVGFRVLTGWTVTMKRMRLLLVVATLLLKVSVTTYFSTLSYLLK